MHLEEVVLEGFKSYATRTTIAGWDREFNAITGLNGSGKSNILDAIVFVLGITNYSQVRANNLQDLIYKRGQAGITKASVTLVFDNSDAENSPIGYEQYKQVSVTRQGRFLFRHELPLIFPRISFSVSDKKKLTLADNDSLLQVLMGGRNKYIINGRNALAQAVQNLFQSVQLNVNNPHFLIMQGRITKVLNMKPPEILGMIEEAAGTRMFEEKKEKALKTIAKKDSKVEEITSLLNEEIGPKLDKLRVEKRNYLDYQKIKTEMERLEKLVIAYEYKANKVRTYRIGFSSFSGPEHVRLRPCLTYCFYRKGWTTPRSNLLRCSSRKWLMNSSSTN
ncbi:MAG: P-loop containing nucleoside triphosphate hydrolase protein [Olpidium bornovanus]|uniref:P-loop containing nucleoside triphosphate hydrolase protein n=1 Tax=Olpidium bornovanus TaxID=278681 RepID=A0A8H7ZYN3_9FUNG|nr:MAG: P-loop containing nucleoside triphosphate hydrolase protein [Olpidium bornovanus]